MKCFNCLVTAWFRCRSYKESGQRKAHFSILACLSSIILVELTFLLMWFFDILREEKNWHVWLGSLEKVLDIIQGNVQMVAWWHYHERVKLILRNYSIWVVHKCIFIEAGTVVIINEGLHYEFVCFWKHQANLGGEMNTLHYR